MWVNNDERGAVGIIGIALIVIAALGVGFAGSRIYSANFDSSDNSVTDQDKIESTNTDVGVDSNQTEPNSTYTHPTLGYTVEIPEGWSYDLIIDTSGAPNASDSLEVKSPDYKLVLAEGGLPYEEIVSGSRFVINATTSTSSLPDEISFMDETSQIGVVGPTTNGKTAGENSWTYYWAYEGNPNVQTSFIHNGLRYNVVYNATSDEIKGGLKSNEKIKTSFDDDMATYENFVATISFK